MRFRKLIPVLVVVSAVAWATPANAAESFDVVVKLRDTAVVASAADGTGGTVVEQVAPDTLLLSVPGPSAEAAAAVVSARSDVEWAEPNKVYKASRTTNDPCVNSSCAGQTQYALAKVGLPTAWDTTTGDTKIKVGVLDSGIDVNHPDLRGHVTNGPNYSSDSTMADGYGHGTHVAGILGASTNNGVGIAGAAWNASLISVKVLGSNGSGTSVTIAQGLRWAADNGIRIANLSLGGETSATVADAVKYAQARGVLVVAAADNAGSTTPVYPAAFPGVLSVGASTSSDTLASFSNRGPSVDVLAPGVNIVSTWPTALGGGGYSVESGTSMATPLVAGTAALLWSARPYLSAGGVVDRIMSTANTVSGSGTVVASGRLNAGSALADPGSGYRLAASDGGIFSYNASFSGSTGGTKLNQPIVTMATPGKTDGYWLIASDGGVFAYGGAQFYGSTGGTKLNQPIVGAASTKSGEGYWLVARDGGVFTFGDAVFFGSAGGQKLNSPITSIVPTVTGHGYWLFAADGGVFAYGDARFYGSAGAQRLNSPIVGGARTPTGEGYWLVAADGGIFAYGDARFYGSAGAIKLAKPVVAMTATPSGLGYWLTASDGGVFSYGDASFKGSTGGQRLNQPIVTVAATP